MLASNTCVCPEIFLAQKIYNIKLFIVLYHNSFMPTVQNCNYSELFYIQDDKDKSSSKCQQSANKIDFLNYAEDIMETCLLRRTT